MTALGSSVGEVVYRLERLAHPSGTWSDFWVAPGASTSWVTAYTATALARAAVDRRLGPTVRDRASTAAGRAADVLLATERSGTWGWSPKVRPDADSTAWAVRALVATGRPVPAGAWTFLDRHARPGGYGTYDEVATGRWTEVTPEVTAAVARARLDGGCADAAELRALWEGPLLAAAGPDGWHSQWWPSPEHPTALVLELWEAAGRPGQPPVLPPLGATASGAADALWAAALTRTPADDALAELMARRTAGGGWPGDTVLLVPAQHADVPPQHTHDARGVFTTATALFALLALPDWTDRKSTATTGALPRCTAYDAGMAAMAVAQGVDPGRAVQVLRALTEESLAAPAPWPARQLSVLAGGLPLEYSVTGTAGLRFTTEVGDPVLPPGRRLGSGLVAVARAARLLGTGAAWSAASSVVRTLADPDLPAPDGTRFWLWAGADLSPSGPPVLKAYLSLLAGDVEGWRSRESAALRAAGVPSGSPALAVVERLKQNGWGHEIGVGCAPGGQWALKVYYELDGWKPDVVRDCLRLAGLPADLEPLLPEVPGVLRASLAARRRAGIAVRVEPRTGRVTDLTVAAAFPPPLVGREELARRVGSWLAAVGSDPGPYERALAVFSPDWDGKHPLRRMLSLFTRTVSADTCSVTVYLRPCGSGHEGPRQGTP